MKHSIDNSFKALALSANSDTGLAEYLTAELSTFESDGNDNDDLSEITAEELLRRLSLVKCLRQIKCHVDSDIDGEKAYAGPIDSADSANPANPANPANLASILNLLGLPSLANLADGTRSFGIEIRPTDDPDWSTCRYETNIGNAQETIIEGLAILYAGLICLERNKPYERRTWQQNNRPSTEVRIDSVQEQDG